MYVSITLAFIENFGCLFVARHQSFYSRPLLRMLRGKLIWRMQGPLFFFISFDWNGETPLHGMACCTGKFADLHTTEFPLCLANHEARAQTHQTEEKYKELQVG